MHGNDVGWNVHQNEMEILLQPLLVHLFYWPSFFRKRTDKIRARRLCDMPKQDLELIRTAH